MSDQEMQPQAESPQDLERLAQLFESTSLADIDSEEVPIEPSRMPMVSRSIRMEQSTMSEIRKVASRCGIPVTQLMRQWVQQGLEKAKADESSTPTQDTGPVVITSAPNETTSVSFERLRSLSHSVRARYALNSGHDLLTADTQARNAKLSRLVHRHAESR